MSKYASAKNVATTERMHSFGRPRGGPMRARLYVRQTRLGTWVVREEGDRRGGSFFTQEAAWKFIRIVFGADAQIIATGLVQKKAA